MAGGEFSGDDEEGKGQSDSAENTKCAVDCRVW